MGVEGLHNRSNSPMCLYGLGVGTERYIVENSSRLNIVGLLDGFRTEGEMYGHPIITLDGALEKNVSTIIVVARPGSCKAIVKRIGQFCKDNNISLLDVNGNDLLINNKVNYTFDGTQGYKKRELLDRIKEYEVISFDLFDTLVARTVSSYTDVFELLNLELLKKSINIHDFTLLRLQSEKELSKSYSPNLQQIYDDLLIKSKTDSISSEELSGMEWIIDYSTMIPRSEMCELVNEIISAGKKVVITTDCYYSYDQVNKILDKAGLGKVDKVLVSCEQETGKVQKLYDKLIESYPNSKILHIGDDLYSDVEKAGEHSIDSFHIYSGSELLDLLGGMGIESEVFSLTDRIKMGMFVSCIFNSPFQFETDDTYPYVKNSYDLGYAMCAPVISDFVYWLNKQSSNQNYKQILFCSRDGYLPKRLFDTISADVKSYYFLSSRTAAIRSGMEDEHDIEYVDNMKYFGLENEELKCRFGIEHTGDKGFDRKKEILSRSAELRQNYRKYIGKFDFDDDKIGLFDFVAKGTSQLFLQKLFTQHIKGFYFLQLEPDFMSDKSLEIEPLYSDEEKNASSIYENYYILETILTAPHSQVLEFDDAGNPVYAEETRNTRDLNTIENVQKGIIDYFTKLATIIPVDCYEVNKKLDEVILSLINRIRITDEDFMSLTVEDPFFGRMTPIRDLIG